MAWKEFKNELNGNRVEGELIKTFLYSIIISLLSFFTFYFVVDGNGLYEFLGKYGQSIFLTAISYGLIVCSIRQVRAYKEMPCMSGMMVGMTTGMIAGFLPGFYVATNNGMFIGSVFGMFIGIGVGIWNGKCSGIMGIMEGIMAGFMGGLMGAMTAFMLINDHLLASSIIVLIISAVILIGLNFMIYNEMKETKRQRYEDHFLTIIVTFILMMITMWLIVVGPRGGLFT